MIKYSLHQIKPIEGTIARIIRDDAYGAIIDVSSSNLALRVSIADLVNEVNRLEREKLQEEEKTKVSEPITEAKSEAN